MFLHVGNNKTIRKSAVIGIFDMDTATVSATTKKYLNKMEKEGRLNVAVEEIPKSFVLYKDTDGGYGVCISQISSGVLFARLDKISGNLRKK